MFTAKTFVEKEELLLYKFCFLKSCPLSREKEFVLDRLKTIGRYLDEFDGSCRIVLRGLADVMLHYREEDKCCVMTCVEDLKKHLRMSVCDAPAVRPCHVAEGEGEAENESTVPDKGTATISLSQNYSVVETSIDCDASHRGEFPIKVENVTAPNPFQGFDPKRTDKELEAFLKKFRSKNGETGEKLKPTITRIRCDERVAAIDRWLKENKKTITKKNDGSTDGLTLCKRNEIQEYWTNVGGSWTIPGDKQDSFLSLFSKAVADGKILNFSEYKYREADLKL